MQRRTDKLVLGLAFVAAVALHAAVLPWLGAAVGRQGGKPTIDAQLKSFDAPSFATPGQVVPLSYQLAYVADSGFDPATIRLDVCLSRSRQADEADPRLFDSQHTLTPGTRTAADQRLDLGQPVIADADGPYWLVATLGLGDQPRDRDLSNNTRITPLYIDGPQTPELSIDRFDTPQQAAPGGAILVEYEVRNTGKGWAANAEAFDPARTLPHWADRVYLSTDATLDATDLPLRRFERMTPLGPEQGYRHRRVELAIPRGVTGEMHLILAADADQVLDQPSFTAGLAVRPITLVDAGEPDLVVADIDEIDRLVIGRPSPVTFSVANLGSSPTLGSNWSDGVYLSRDDVLDEDDLPITQVGADQPLQPRSRYETTLPVTLPDSVEAGQWYLIVRADAADDVDEAGFEDNNALARPVTVLTQAQADAEIQLGDPDRPERMVIQWIEHERFEEHIARLSRTTQPALQDRADPVPDAPLVDNPRPPSVAQNPSKPAGNPADPDRTTDPDTNADSRPRPAVPDASASDLAPRPQTPGTQTPQRRPGIDGDSGDLPIKRPGIDDPNAPTPTNPLDPTPSDDKTPSPTPGDRRVESPADPTAPDTDRTTDSQTTAERESDTDSQNPDDTESTEPADPKRPTPADTPSDNPEADKPSTDDGQGDAEEPKDDQSTSDKPAQDKPAEPDGADEKPADPSEDETPTRAPRDPSEAPPVSVKKLEVKLQEGKVLVGKGIKVTTKLPTPPGTGIRRLSLPRNARVRVTFNNKGEVYEAKVIKSTNEKVWDAAIEASLYRWSAEGEEVDNAEPYIAIEWNYLLNDLFDDE